MTKNDGYIHPDFKLNGKTYSPSEIRTFASTTLKTRFPFEKDLGEFLLQWFSPANEIEVQTSGSTGVPKIIKLQKSQMANSAKATASCFNLPSKTRALLCLPAKYIAGKMMLVRAMLLGWHLDYVVPSSSPLDSSSKTYDFSAMVPLQLENSLEHIERIKTLLVGGAQVSITLKEKLKELSTSIFETYGMTETCTHVAARPINKFKASISSNGVEMPFLALPKVKFTIDNRECLIISAPKVADGLVVTNDIIKLNSDTEFEWLGRFDNVINSGGVKLIPEQIEKKLKEAIEEPFFVAGIPDEQLGQKLVVVVEGNNVEEDLRKSLKVLTHLTNYERPKNIYELAAFVYTETGKIKRSETLALLP